MKINKIFLLVIVFSLTGCDQNQKLENDKIAINGYYGQYDANKKSFTHPSESLHLKKDDYWRFLPKKDIKPIRIGVLFPNSEVNDSYWTAIRTGIEKEAKIHSIQIELKASNNHSDLAQHKKQFKYLTHSDLDIIMIAPMHYRAMDNLINQTNTIPILGIVNDLHAEELDGKIMVPSFDMGYQAAEFVKRHAYQLNKESITVAFLPGPINSNWASGSLRGFVNGMRDFDGIFKLIDPFWGNIENETQQLLLENIFDQTISIDYIIGNATAAKLAAKQLKIMGSENKISIISTYFTPDLKKFIETGEVLAAPTDQPELLGRIAVDMARRIIKGEIPGKDIPFRVSPDIPIISNYQF